MLHCNMNLFGIMWRTNSSWPAITLSVTAAA